MTIRLGVLAALIRGTKGASEEQKRLRAISYWTCGCLVLRNDRPWNSPRGGLRVLQVASRGLVLDVPFFPFSQQNPSGALAVTVTITTSASIPVMSRWETTPEAEAESTLWPCDPGAAGADVVWAGFPERFELPRPGQSRRRPSSGIRTVDARSGPGVVDLGANSGLTSRIDKPRVEARHVNGWRR
ncbi:hypothetical protein V8C35DRAFT_235918 [Trichoderma chlorosporum]